MSWMGPVACLLFDLNFDQDPKETFQAIHFFNGLYLAFFLKINSLTVIN